MSEFYVFTCGINQEFIVENGFKAKGLEPFCLKGRKMVRHARKQMMRIFPVISRYVFVKLNDAEDFQLAKSTDGVMNVLSNNGKPVAVPAYEIEELKRREIAGEFNVLPPTKKKKERPSKSFAILERLQNPQATIEV